MSKQFGRRRAMKKSARFEKEKPKQDNKLPPPSEVYGEVWVRGGNVGIRVFHRDLARMEVYPDPRMDKPVDGEIVRIALGRQSRFGAVPARVLERMGMHPKGLATAVALGNSQIPVDFNPAALKECDKLEPYKWNAKQGRVDLRKHAFVTIDGADARDFDDAVWAEPKDGGFHLMVAIADVAHYLAEDGALDTDAMDRGNSTYFPDLVVPMLPEKLSNDLCSLRPHEDRPVLVADMEIDGHGKLVRHTFVRACICSAARLTYEQVEAREVPPALLPAMDNLYAAYDALASARTNRGAIDLDIPEAKVVMGRDGRVQKVEARARLTSHRLIEEFMITANVAAAELLSRKGGAVQAWGTYRIHDRPGKEKLLALKAVLGPLGFAVPALEAPPKQWARLAEQVSAHPAAQVLLRSLLQSQQQAKYDTDNIGHYGLALPLYSHFTSPIRRYADVLVHRAILRVIGAVKTAPQDMRDVQHVRRILAHINITERRSQQAEWEARDRMMAEHYAEMQGMAFEAVVVKPMNFGVFVAIEGLAEGLIPGWNLDEHNMSFVPTLQVWRRFRGGKGELRMGSRIGVILTDADRASGRLTFNLA